jgi:hypothetical protein
MNDHSSDVAFTPAVKRIQAERGSRKLYERADFESEVNDDLRAFLAEIDSAFLATASKDGQPYIQHRGGPKGFLRAIDEHTIGFVDFAGNRQYVTAGNLSENDRVCLFVIDYERRRRLKIWGTARVVPLDEALLAKLGDPSYRAKSDRVVLLTVTAWDVNCPQHLPQKLDAEEVGLVIDELESRIALLERENARLREAAR